MWLITINLCTALIYRLYIQTLYATNPLAILMYSFCHVYEGKHNENLKMGKITHEKDEHNTHTWSLHNLNTQTNQCWRIYHWTHTQLNPNIWAIMSTTHQSRSSSDHSDLLQDSVLGCFHRKWSFMAFQDFLELAQEMIESQFLRKQELNRNTHTHTHTSTTHWTPVCWESCFLWG